MTLLLPWFAAQAQHPADSVNHLQICKPDILAAMVTARTGVKAQGGPIQITADRGQASQSEASLEGNVLVQQGDQRLQAASVLFDRIGNQLRTEGGFVYSNPSLVIRGSQTQWDLTNDQGQFNDVQYYFAGRRAQGEAKQVLVDNAKDQSHLQNATYSTCIRSEEFWQLRTRKLDLDENMGRGSARDITLAFKGVPILYLPYLSFPINDERQSGFLVPTFGYKGGNGFDLRVPYYWNIAPNRDMTVAPRILSNRGLLLDSEYRFLHPKDQGIFRVEYVPYDRKFGGERYAFDIRHQANFLPNFYSDLLYEHISDEHYLKDFSNSIGLFLPSYLEQHLNTTYAGEDWILTTQVQRFQTIDEQLFTPDNEPYDRLPQLFFDGGWWQRSYGLSYTLRSELVRFDRTSGITGTRLDFQPGITLPLEWPAGYITPRLSYRYTAYDLQNTQAGANSAPSRSASIFSLDSGLFFERPVKWQWWGNRVDIQTLEPRLFYLYVPFRDQSAIPNFDSATVDTGYPWLFLENRFVGADRLGDANQITAALTSRLLNSEEGGERLRASIGHVRYFRTPRVSLEGTIPEAVIAPGIIAEGLVYLRSDLALRGILEWDQRLGNARRNAWDMRYDSGDGRFARLSYSYAENDLEQFDIALLWPFNERWRTIGRWNYSLRDSRNVDTLGGFEYRSCCWALRMLARQQRYNPQDENVHNSIFLELELTGLTSIGADFNKILRETISGYEVP
jgi:LPS-assembly protein